MNFSVCNLVLDDVQWTPLAKQKTPCDFQVKWAEDGGPIGKDKFKKPLGSISLGG